MRMYSILIYKIYLLLRHGYLPYYLLFFIPYFRIPLFHPRAATSTLNAARLIYARPVALFTPHTWQSHASYKTISCLCNKLPSIFISKNNPKFYSNWTSQRLLTRCRGLFFLRSWDTWASVLFDVISLLGYYLQLPLRYSSMAVPRKQFHIDEDLDSLRCFHPGRGCSQLYG